jgi:hypothetical protein
MESKTTRTILIILGVLVLCCCIVLGGGYLLTRYGFEYLGNTMIVQDPAQISQVSDKLADYDLPPGYEEEFVMDILGIQALFSFNGNNGSMITMMQINTSLYGDSESTRQQFQDSFLQQFQTDNIQFTAVDQRPIEIRGDQTTLYEYEGSDSQGNQFRQWTTVFEGKNGTVMLMIVGSKNTWDDAEMEAFIQSMNSTHSLTCRQGV